MFSNCTSLTTAPALPATTLATYCYAYMFSNCISLNSITCYATTISASNALTSWVSNVAVEATFTTLESTAWTTRISGIPSGWDKINI